MLLILLFQFVLEIIFPNIHAIIIHFTKKDKFILLIFKFITT